ncbi:glutathione S-transferase [Favolaschia claudopus]|uniref:Glutathione S-transferase n=1 Tax=Favolaschia claudopus TaxID=2862362 RepID=A0AAW0DLJ5_9AGAR
MPLIVHHLNVSQSERIPWLCEELSIPYTLKTYRRAPVLAPPEYKALHPSETSPIIQDGEGDALITIAESGACMEYIAHRYGNGGLFLPPTHPDYAQFLYWWHWANGTFQPAMLLNTMVGRMGVPDDHPRRVMGRERMNMMLRALNERVKKNKWLAGEEFTVADIMLVFSLTTMLVLLPVFPEGVRGRGRVPRADREEERRTRGRWRKAIPGWSLHWVRIRLRNRSALGCQESKWQVAE